VGVGPPVHERFGNICACVHAYYLDIRAWVCPRGEKVCMVCAPVCYTTAHGCTTM
jgi:hypothetical protein